MLALADAFYVLSEHPSALSFFVWTVFVGLVFVPSTLLATSVDPPLAYSSRICCVNQLWDGMYEFKEVNPNEQQHVCGERGSGTFSRVYQSLVQTDNNGRPLEKPFYVALKRLHCTSSASRVENEIRHLVELGAESVDEPWQNHCVPLLGVYGDEDQYTLVLPYFDHIAFRDMYRSLSVIEVKKYMRALFRSLSYVHSHGIIHRDVKPSNFLLHRDRSKYLLVDFGLAQKVPATMPQNINPEGSTSNRDDTAERSRAEESETSDQSRSPEKSRIPVYTRPSSTINQAFKELADNLRSLFACDQRRSSQAPRAGTRGFRAPEVLLRYPHQTTAIDVWSAGVILLSILSHRFPFFDSQDDCQALFEIAQLIGSRPLISAAKHSCNRTLSMPVLDGLDMQLLAGPGVLDAFPACVWDLLKRCLDPDWRTRISAAEALSHPFLADVRLDEEKVGEGSDGDAGADDSASA